MISCRLDRKPHAFSPTFIRRSACSRAVAGVAGKVSRRNLQCLPHAWSKGWVHVSLDLHIILAELNQDPSLDSTLFNIIQHYSTHTHCLLCASAPILLHRPSRSPQHRRVEDRAVKAAHVPDKSGAQGSLPGSAQHFHCRRAKSRTLTKPSHISSPRPTLSTQRKKCPGSRRDHLAGLCRLCRAPGSRS